MIDINAEAEKSLSDVKCKAVFQYPKNFNNLPIISYYTVTECGGFYADNDESIQDGHIQIDIWAEIPKECSDLAAEVNEVMTKDSWVREMSMDVPENDKKIYVWYKADENGNTVYETVKSNGKDVTRPAVLYKGMAADSYEAQYKAYINSTVKAEYRNNINTKGIPMLKEDALAALQDVLKKNGMELNIKYIDETNSYVYMEYTVSYRLSSGFIKYNKVHNYTGIARFSAV